jgi:fucose 4-O-acetylase-like acetyltransferase
MKNNNYRNLSTQRIEYIDLLKCYAIFCVLWGHAIQYLKAGADFLDNPVNAFILSFHMPLFFMISGFFFQSSLKLNLKDFLIKKSVQLLLPCLVWSVLFELFTLLFKLFLSENYVFDWITEFKNIFPLNGGFWFLRDLFICYVTVFVLFKLVKKWGIYFVCIASISLALITPLPESVFPVFWVGIFLKKHYKFVILHINKILLISALVFAVLLGVWYGNYAIYLPNLFTADIIKFRFISGIPGSLFFFALFQKLYKENNFYSKLSEYGQYTMAIYILQTYILQWAIPQLINFPTMNIWVYSLVITPAIALIVFVLCVGIIKLIRNKYLKLLLFGNIENMRIKC